MILTESLNSIPTIRNCSSKQPMSYTTDQLARNHTGNRLPDVVQHEEQQANIERAFAKGKKQTLEGKTRKAEVCRLSVHDDEKEKASTYRTIASTHEKRSQALEWPLLGYCSWQPKLTPSS